MWRYCTSHWTLQTMMTAKLFKCFCSPCFLKRLLVVHLENSYSTFWLFCIYFTPPLPCSLVTVPDMQYFRVYFSRPVCFTWAAAWCCPLHCRSKAEGGSKSPGLRLRAYLGLCSSGSQSFESSFGFTSEVTASGASGRGSGTGRRTVSCN